MCTLRVVGLNLMFFLVEGEKGVDIFTVDVLGRDVTFPVVAKQVRQFLVIGLFATKRLHQRFAGGLRVGEMLLSVTAGRPEQEQNQRNSTCSIHD
ncbi:hypothetical protein D3C76_1479420 [compost metagenome]